MFILSIITIIGMKRDAAQRLFSLLFSHLWLKITCTDTIIIITTCSWKVFCKHQSVKHPRYIGRFSLLPTHVLTPTMLNCPEYWNGTVSTKKSAKTSLYCKNSPWSMSSNIDLASGCRNKDLGVKIISCNCKKKKRSVWDFLLIPR